MRRSVHEPFRSEGRRIGSDGRTIRAPRIRRPGKVARLGVTVGLLVVLGTTLNPGEVLGQLRQARLPWLALALVVSVAQVAVSAWRWRFTAGRIGIPLPFGEAFREYYLATFLNQVLPGGVLGDVSRAWRHGRSGASESRESAARAVLLERASGQMVMLVTAALCAGALVLGGSGLGAGTGALERGLASRLVPGSWSELPGGFAAGVAGSVLFLGVLAGVARPKGGLFADLFAGLWERSWAESRRALLSPGPFLVQVATSLVAVASYVVMYVVAARAIGVETPTPLLALLVPPVLLAMLIPLSLAGWGLREGAAALLWAAVGLSATEGTAASVMYGLLVLVSSLPGALVLLLRRPPGSGPGRRGRPVPIGSAGKEDEGPGPGSPQAGG